MITKYSKLAKKNVTGGYLALSLHPEDAEILYSCVKKLKLKDVILPEDYHVTVMFDEFNPDITVNKENFPEEFKADIDSILILGSGKWEAITLLLDNCKELHDFFKYLTRLGFKHSYYTFTPHISIKYQPTREDVNTVKKQLLFLLKEAGLKTIRLQKIRQEILK